MSEFIFQQRAHDFGCVRRLGRRLPADGPLPTQPGLLPAQRELPVVPVVVPGGEAGASGDLQADVRQRERPRDWNGVGWRQGRCR